MHPSVFINDLWNGNTVSEVFVAMSFHESFKSRFDDIYRPAIEGISVDSVSLSAVRVDERKSGDSIISEIIKGISQSIIVIADISAVEASQIGLGTHRNGNVMYELGLAHAVKSPVSVIIIKDDDDKMLFDVSSIPYYTIDFSNVETAKKRIQDIVIDRIKEADGIIDFKLKQYSKAISPNEYLVLKKLSGSAPGQIADFSFEVTGRRIISVPDVLGLEKLVSVGLVESHIQNGSQYPWYALTSRGRKLCRLLEIHLDSENSIESDSLTSK